MSGPLPKPPALRRRRNRVIGAAVLPAEGRQGPIPRLPTRKASEGETRPWHPLTRRWWRDVWRSPMATQYDALDEYGLLALAELIDQFWCNPTARLSAEIGRAQQGYGLTPADRARLHWTIEPSETEPGRRHPRPARNPAREDDPRAYLELVSTPEGPGEA
jgi:hypothetical protein